MSKSNRTKPKVHPGPCSVPKCGIGKFDPSNRYVHFFSDYVYRQYYKITDTDCYMYL